MGVEELRREKRTMRRLWKRTEGTDRKRTSGTYSLRNRIDRKKDLTLDLRI